MERDRERLRADGREGEVEGIRAGQADEDGIPRKQIYLRTLYPLNPGIPHFVDVPGGW